MPSELDITKFPDLQASLRETQRAVSWASTFSFELRLFDRPIYGDTPTTREEAADISAKAAEFKKTLSRISEPLLAELTRACDGDVEIGIMSFASATEAIINTIAILEAATRYFLNPSSIQDVEQDELALRLGHMWAPSNLSQLINAAHGRLRKLNGSKLTAELQREHYAAVAARVNARRETPDLQSEADRNADTSNKKPAGLPRNPEVLRLIHVINKRDPKRSQNDVALEFCEGNRGKANSMLRQKRRFNHLVT